MSPEYQAIKDGIENALCYAVPIIQQEALVSLAEMRRPSVLYRPTLILDGNAWVAIYSDLPTGVAGFGASPAEAMEAFDKAWAERIESTAGNSR